MTSKILPSLYLVTNRHQTNGRPLLPLLEEALQAGVRLVQLREKDLDTRSLLKLATEVLHLTHSYGATLLINDRVDIVKSIGADGVHLPANSLPIYVARQILGTKALIGVSTHTPQEVSTAESQGADFIVLGPVYETPSKRNLGVPLGIQTVEKVARKCQTLLYAIGGLNPERVGEVRKAGAYGVAVISSIFGASSISSATQHLLKALNEV